MNALRHRSASQAQGADAEERARIELERHGLILVERNFRCRGGEIDLIMRDRDCLVFVEVRARSSAGFGGAAASVTARKQARIVLAAQLYLQRFRFPPACRFDVVALEAGRIEWLADAFRT